MKNANSESFSPSIPRPRTFSQTTAAPKIKGDFGPQVTQRGTTTVGKPGHTTGPLSVPRSGCCGHK